MRFAAMRAVRSSLSAVIAAAILNGHAFSTTRVAEELAACHLDGVAEEVQCGVHEVYEDRALVAGRRIAIQFAVLPPLRRAAAADPLFVLAGGPGQGARSFAPAAARYFKQVRRSRAIVLVDLRGTGGSHPLDCGADEDETSKLATENDLFLGRAPRCLKELDADVRHYTHAAALADLDEIRRRLGYRSINLWGGSWGTRAALLYALGYPAAVRSVVLDGAAPPEAAFPRTVAQEAERALNLLMERCAADPECRRTFPRPREALDALLARLAQAPAVIRLRHPRTANVVSVTVTRDVAAEIIRVALYTTTDTARLLQTVRHAADGHFAPLVAQYVHSATMTTDDMALGVTMAILCSEDLPLVEAADFEADGRGTFVGASYAMGWRSRCDGWPAGPRLSIDPAAKSNAAALILSGDTDPVTPPRWGNAMGQRFPRHQHLVVAGAAHNASFSGCVPDLIAAFLDRGDAAPFDTTCAGKVPLPPIVISDAGGRP